MVASRPGSMFLAGGTDLLPNLKRRQFDLTALVSLNGLPDSDTVEGDERTGVRIGARVTLDRLANHPALQTAYRALAQAAGTVSTPQVRYMGTLGGNLLVDPRCNYYNQT
jgi:CO/xanthine dehydrogenase FAD-binding subunit